jgi:hypothetical protein
VYTPSAGSVVRRAGTRARPEALRVDTSARPASLALDPAERKSASGATTLVGRFATDDDDESALYCARMSVRIRG